MAGIASISGSTTPHVVGGPATPSATPGVVPDGSSGAGPGNFTAFPASYAGFGSADTGFGTIGIRNGAISVIPFNATAAIGGVPPAAIPATVTGPAGPINHQPNSQTGAEAPAPKDANADTAPASAGSTPSTTPKVPGGYTIFGSSAGAASATPLADGPPAVDAVPVRSPNDTANAGGDHAGDGSGAQAPGAGLLGVPAGGKLGAQAAGPIPGSPPPEPSGLPDDKNSGPPPGLLGSAPPAGTAAPPATAAPAPASGLQPPDLYQPSNGATNGTGGPPAPGSAQQQAQAAQAAQQVQQEQRADAAAADTQIAIADLQRINLRLSAAYDQGNGAAAKQLQPIAVTVYNGELQGSIWANLGTTPPQPFAAPEIPPAFLNVAS